jgi:hypothetical protein
MDSLALKLAPVSQYRLLFLCYEWERFEFKKRVKTVQNSWSQEPRAKILELREPRYELTLGGLVVERRFRPSYS